MELEQGLERVNQLVSDRTGTSLSAIELAILRGAWLGQNYEAIAETTNYSASYLSRTLAPQLWQRLSNAFGETVSKKSFRACVERLVAQHGIVEHQNPGNGDVLVSSQTTLAPISASSATQFNLTALSVPQCDWGEAIDVSVFYGRTQELKTLGQWVLNDRCRLVAILGMGGMGKTALSVKLARQIQDEFEFVIWRSLRNAPPLTDILREIIPLLSAQKELELSNSESTQISRLLHYLQEHHCLIVLDNVESILQSGNSVGSYLPGYEAYGEMLQRIGGNTHRSCMVITSREKLTEVALLEGEQSSVRTLQLAGLSNTESIELFAAKGLSGNTRDRERLTEVYRGNPLALKIVATSIQDLFDGNIAAFLQEGTAVFNGIRRLLDQQFTRLSALEQQVMYWLAINREWVSLTQLQADIVPMLPKARLLESLECLSRRSLIERSPNGFTEQPVVMEYTTEKLIETVSSEIQQRSPHSLVSYALMKARTKDYVRTSQTRMILEPLVQQLHIFLPTKSLLIEHLRKLLLDPDNISLKKPGYAAGNLINLLRFLEADLTGYNLSQLTLWQAYLADILLHRVNLAYADLTHTVFAETLSNVLAVTISPDNSLLATMGGNGVLCLWELVTGKRLLTIPAHTVWTLGLIFSPDQKFIVSGSFDRTIKIWEVKTGKCTQVWETFDLVWDIKLSPDGKILASSHEDGSIRLWNFSTGELLHHLIGHTAQVSGLAFHPQGDLLVSCSHDCAIRVWDIATKECLQILSGHTAPVWSVSFNPEGTILASASYDETVRLWQLQTEECFRILQQNAGRIQSAIFTPDGQALVADGASGMIRLWNVQTGECFGVLQGHKDTIWSIAMTSDGQTLASASGDHTVKLWNLPTKQCIHVLKGQGCAFQSVAFNPQGTLLASGSDDFHIRLWNPTTGECLRTQKGHQGHIWTITFHPQGHLLASCTLNGEIKMWDVQTGKCLYTLQPTTHFINGLSFHPQGHLLASSCDESCFKLWDVQTGSCIRTIAINDNTAATEIVFHPQGHQLISGHYDSSVRLWDAETGSCLRVFQGHTHRVWTVNFHPQGYFAASGGEDGTVRLWDVESGDCPCIFHGHTGAILYVGFNATGTLLASSSTDRTIRIWDIATGNCVRVLEGHTNMVRSSVFNWAEPQQHILASASLDETIRLWDVASGDCLRVLRPQRLYEGMDITGAIGLTEAQKETLKALGAVESVQPF